MPNYLKNIAILFSIVFPLYACATNNTQLPTKEKTELAIYYTFKGNIEKEYNSLVEKKLKSIGFNLTDPHKRVNDQYEVKYGSTVLDVLSFMPIVKDESILPLLNIDPRIAGFAPFNLVIHKKLDENVTHIGHLLPDVMLDILGIENQEVRSKFSATFKALDATIAQELGGHVATIPYKKLPEKRMINYEYTFDAPEDMDDFIDEFQNTFELAFIDKGYLIAGFHNFMEATDNAEEVLSEYDAFWTYSLCHLEFSYHMFDNPGGRPEAGLFAPCTMYMYIRKGSNKLVLGMYRLENWSTTLNITDKTRLSLIDKLDTQIPKILKSLHMKPTPNVNPLTLNSKTNTNTKDTQTAPKNTLPAKKREILQAPKDQSITKNKESVQDIKIVDQVVKITIPSVPKVIKCASSSTSNTDRSIKFSKRVPPGYVPHSFGKSHKTKSTSNTKVGEVHSGTVSAYLRGALISVEKAKELLKSAGFEIVSISALNKAKDLLSIVFTDKSLQAMSNKENRGFMASLRLLIDKKEKTISITNPMYMAKGFLQNDFDEKNANKLLIRLVQTFQGLKNSKDKLKFQLLPKYQFMKGMPKYQNMIEVASGTNLLEKLKNNDKVVFTQ
ncbi:MAG: hypothetical protein L3J43_02170, partial [Sulfurovum sp.]|nr:hypothetical protein [Sulfurovum sp.]